jgi:hypothetical protein
MNSNYSVLAVLAAAVMTTIAGAQPQDPGQPAAFPASPFQPDLTPGYVLIEGDIQIPLAQYMLLISGAPPDATFGTVSYWPGGVVPFDFVTSGTGAVSSANQTRAITAMNMIEQRTGVDFRPAIASDQSRIRFQNSAFNSSPVGRQGGTQIINIFNWTFPVIVCHELYHSLGYWHEQSRPDRQTYITINALNICGSQTSTACTAGSGPGQCCLCVDGAGNCVPCGFNFDVRVGAGTWGPYDFDSFMHYPRTAFSCNSQDTITVNPPWNAQWQNAIGQSDHFSRLDELSCRGIYPRNGDRWLRSGSFPLGGGGFFDPYNTMLAMYGSMPANGTLFIDPGTYAMPIANVPQNMPITIRATYGPVTITDAP